MSWTPERIAEVKSLAEKGLSAAQIAIEIGDCTRNAVVGIGFRNNFRFHGGYGGGANHTKETRKRSPRPRPQLKCEDVQIQTRNVTLNELESHHCRWPIGLPTEPDFAFCGGKKLDGFPYCVGHCQLAYRQNEDDNAQS